jgi:hypothetical protein
MTSLNNNVLSYILSYTNLDIIKRCYLISHKFKKVIDNELLWMLLFKRYNKDYNIYKSLYRLNTVRDTFIQFHKGLSYVKYWRLSFSLGLYDNYIPFGRTVNIP